MINKNREQHMLMVAKYMHDRAEDYGLDPDEMYVLGLLHDIGYLENEQPEHASEGMKLLRKIHLKPELCFAVRHHGDNLASVQAKTHYLPKELVLLVEADMSVDYEGKYVGFQKRVSDIVNFYGTGEVARKNVKFIKQYWKYNGLEAPTFTKNNDAILEEDVKIASIPDLISEDFDEIENEKIEDMDWINDTILEEDGEVLDGNTESVIYKEQMKRNFKLVKSDDDDDEIPELTDDD